MKKDLIKIIRILGLGISEFVISIELSFVNINSIEWVAEENKIFLNIFEDYEIQHSYDFDIIDIEDQIKIYKLLSSIAYN